MPVRWHLQTPYSLRILNTSLIVELALLGLCTGFLAGLLGLGGGMLMVPVLTFLLHARGFPEAYTVKMAVATSLATICFTSLSSVRAHHKRGAVLWPVARQLAPGILVGSFLGSQIASALPSRLLGYLFAVFVTFSATQMFLNRKPLPSRTLPGKAGMFGAGGGIGLLSSLVGAGGAFVSVPFMTWCNIPIHKAVATSSALGFPIALAGTVGYLIAGLSLPEMPSGTLGYLYWPGLLVLSLSSICTAPLGARVAHGMDIAPLKKVFASLLYCIALYFALR
ncbi:MAG: sulfite exporter TauE/SafE family protein [Rhodoferax sp.]|nr:sulfite exporter TauE/SafE family protein [Rhodoferax sp.]